MRVQLAHSYMRTKVLFAKQNHARNHSHTHTSGSRICMYVHKFSMSRYYSFLIVRLLLYLNFIEDTQIMAINISPQSSILVKIPTKFRLRARTDHTNDTNTHTHKHADRESSERMSIPHCFGWFIELVGGHKTKFWSSVFDFSFLSRCKQSQLRK